MAFVNFLLDTEFCVMVIDLVISFYVKRSVISTSWYLESFNKRRYHFSQVHFMYYQYSKGDLVDTYTWLHYPAWEKWWWWYYYCVIILLLNSSNMTTQQRTVGALGWDVASCEPYKSEICSLLLSAGFRRSLHMAAQPCAEGDCIPCSGVHLRNQLSTESIYQWWEEKKKNICESRSSQSVYVILCSI